jgi:SAM-dependent methyltransferase
VDCGFITTGTELDSATLAALYGRNYFHGGEYLDYAREKESLRVNFRKRLRVLESLAGSLRGKLVLEIGSAYGFFLELAQEYEMHAQGLDIAVDAVRHARESLGVRADEGDYLAVRTDPVDVIAMWDTVEHLSRPDRYIEKAASDLRAGGLLAITTGDIGSVNARLRGRRWRMIHPPTHLHYFSLPTLSRLLSQHGLEVVHSSHPGVSRRLHSILHGIFATRAGESRGYRALKSFLPNISLTANLFDIMFVVARKPSAGQNASHGEKSV